jgi:hypothetical protein
VNHVNDRIVVVKLMIGRVLMNFLYVPPDIIAAQTLFQFRRRLKTYFFIYIFLLVSHAYSLSSVFRSHRL